MKAIRVREFGGPEVLLLEDVPDPQAGPGQVVVRAPRRRRQSGGRLPPGGRLSGISPDAGYGQLTGKIA